MCLYAYIYMSEYICKCGVGKEDKIKSREGTLGLRARHNSAFIVLGTLIGEEQNMVSFTQSLWFKNSQASWKHSIFRRNR